MLIEEWQAKNLYVNKSELETALGVELKGVKTCKFNFKKEISSELLPYCSMAYFNEQQAVTLLQGENPTHFVMNDGFYPIFMALKGAIESGEIKDGEIIPADYDYHHDSLSIGHSELERWAKHYGYKWILPPYNPMQTIKTDQSLMKPEIIEELRAENAGLKARIIELESQPQKQSAVNYDDFSIYGHTTTEIKAIFAVIQRYWINHDITQPDTIANADDIKNWIRENFPEISNTNAEAIQKITRPLKAKFIGRKEKG
ncbi:MULTISPECIES: hypothetical protein [Pasteurellaceae]|uniref:hypothetical protein n=1 Tax=Pasteurellaceae TaxID=712 RepID=UPI003566C319